MNPPKPLQDQVVLVTGAAGQLGQEYTRALVDAGAEVIATDLAGSPLEQRYRDAENVLTVSMDVTDPQSVRAAFDRARDEHGRLDVLVNNAGIAVFSPFEARTLDEFMDVLKVNLGGTMLCSQQATRIMKSQDEGGRIINIGSVYGVVSGDPRIYTDCDRNTSEVYGASKAGVIQMTRYLAAHLAPYNIRVNALSPGGVFNHQGEDFVARYSDRTPMGRMAQADEMCGTLIYLASRESSYVTGQNIVVDGGLTAW